MAEPDHAGARLDPRIKGELDKLNSTSEEINRLEKELDDARQQFRVTLTESSFKLSEAAKRCGKSVKKAVPFHEARIKAKKAHEKVQEAAYSYQRAVGMFRAAKETITIAEETSMQGNKKREFDSALQEMLNHATVKLNAAEQEKVRGQKEHQQLSKAYVKSQARVELLAKKLRKSIAKSTAYYDLRDAFYSRLENLKDSVEQRQKLLAKCKKRYREALHNLERISEDIHRSRQLQLEASLSLQERSSGVGAESEPEPNTNSDEEGDEVGEQATGGRSKAPDERETRDNTTTITSDLSKIAEHGASGGAGASVQSSSYSSSPEDGEPRSPVLTEHGLPTLSRYESTESDTDPDFYKSKVAIAKIPGILPEDQQVIEATYRGYRSFDAELTQEEVTALRQKSSKTGGAEAPVVMIEPPEGDAGDNQDEDSEEELEIYEPEEIEMSQFAAEGTSEDGIDLGLQEENSVELTAFEQETQLNGTVNSSPEESEEESEEEEEKEEKEDETLEDVKNSDGQDEARHSEVNQTPPDPGDTQAAENGRASPVETRVRSLSFGFQQTLQEEDKFEEPDRLLSPIQKFKVSELDRPGSPALFQYRVEEHKQDVHQADDTSVFKYENIPNDDAAIKKDANKGGESD